MLENPITYCMNVHSGESLADIGKALEVVTIPLRNALGVRDVFPVGLRFGAVAAKALRAPEQKRRFASLMARNRMAAIGVNGFPFGTFHGEEVKTAVYEPDWSDMRRVRYTCDLFYALTQLPAMRMGSHNISVTTVPLAYDEGQGCSELFLKRMCDMALFLRKLEGFTGQRLCLALEPEPDCLLESTQTTIDFFERLWRHPEWKPAWREYIGVCFDTCHFALGYEDPLSALKTLVAAKIPIARIQASAALEFTPLATEQDFEPFLDAVYLHQTRRQEERSRLTAYADLTRDIFPELIGRHGRIHYHVPLSWTGNDRLGSTRHTLTPDFWRFVRAGGWPVEVETYAYSVYPEQLRTRTLSELLLADICWVRDQLRGA